MKASFVGYAGWGFYLALAEEEGLGWESGQVFECLLLVVDPWVTSVVVSLSARVWEFSALSTSWVWEGPLHTSRVAPV